VTADDQADDRANGLVAGRRLLFVHAHPDDESSKGAATAARYVDEGARVVLVTCTDGAAGDVLNPSFDAALLATRPMEHIRAGELAAAVAAIGFHAVHLLGFRDSGWHEDPATVPDGVFARVPLDVAAGALADVMRRERPHVVVTYPENGGYPHPDHVMTHLVTMRALELAADTWEVPKVYATTSFLHERVVALHEAMLAAELASPYEDWLESGRRPRVEPHARIRCEDTFPRRDAALSAHASQVDPGGTWFAVPRDLERSVYPWEAYLLLRSYVATRVPADDLFDGLDVMAWDAAEQARVSGAASAGR
jgi:mycothiol S-conjugate amidase